MHAIAKLDTFEPRHVGAMQAYLRQSVINRIRDEMRRFTRRPANVELHDDFASEEPSPLEHAIHEEAYARYRTALDSLKPRERELVIARVEAQWTTRGNSRALRIQFGRWREDGGESRDSAAHRRDEGKEEPS